MKQILQNLGSGETMLANVPSPRCPSGFVLIETTKTLVSLGTEKMLIDFGKGSLLEKARSQPDKVKQVLQKVKADGLFNTLDAVKSKLDQPIPLGYCNVGVVAGGDVYGYPEGTRVASNGNHAEVVAVPGNLCARIPDLVSDEEAAFAVVGAIGLQGIRLLNPTLGERVVVMGLGLIGLMAVQILRANGCQVLGIDLDSTKCDLAREFGAEVCDLSIGGNAVAAANEFTEGNGVDAVLITASAKTDAIMHDAATMCRKRGRIVLVGVVGLKLQRDDFYKKELSFQVSCSYGPGRYDPNYEGKGYDYPQAFVRWTEQRNMSAVLQLIADGLIDVKPLISHRYGFDDALTAYEIVTAGKALGIILDYGEAHSVADTKSKFSRYVDAGNGKLSKILEHPRVSFIGAGNFTTRNLLPAMQKIGGVDFHTIVSGSGISSGIAATKFGFVSASSDAGSAIAAEETDVIFVTTPHNSHARFVCQALNAGKHVFVEKPLALNIEELEKIKTTIAETAGKCLLMIGFNRRFSPHTQQFKKWLMGTSGTKSVVITVNAGAIPADHWTQDSDVGGGRIIGEACHFVDLARYLVESPIAASHATFLGGNAGQQGDSAMLQLRFEDESIASIHYLATGHGAFPKERVEVFVDGKVMTCDNFRKTTGYGLRGGCSTKGPDKGHHHCLQAFVNAIKTGGSCPIALDEIFEISEHVIRMVKSR